MVKGLRKRLIIAGCGLCLALLAGIFWLLDSVAGNTWLFETLAHGSSATLEVTIEKPLWSGLRARNLVVAWPGGEVSGKELEIDWQPWQLLRGTLLIERLSIDAPHISWEEGPSQEGASTPDSPFTFAWPKPPAWLRLLQIELRHVEITTTRITPPDPPPLEFSTLSANLLWQEEKLQLQHQLSLNADDAFFGSWQLDFARHTLAAELEMSRGDRQLELNTALDGNRDLTSGPLQMTYRETSGYGAHLETHLALGASRLDMTEIDLRRLSGPDQVSGSGYLDWQHGPLEGAVDLTFSSLDLAPESGWKTRLDGALTASLGAAGYQGQVRIANRVAGWEALDVSTRLEGDWEQVTLSSLEAEWLQGRLGGQVDASWGDNLQISAHLAAEHLDPRAINRQLYGDINFDLQGNLTVGENNQVSASWRSTFPSSTMRGHPFGGICNGGWTDDDLLLEECRFENHAALFDLKGRLSQRLTLEFSAADLGGFSPDAGGALSGAGWLAYKRDKLRGELTIQGRELAYRDLQLKQLEVALALPSAPGLMDMKLAASDLKVADTLLSQLVFSASGDLQQHTLNLRANWPEGELLATAGGSWRSPAWSGQVQKLAGSAREIGSWALENPAGVKLGPKYIEVETLELAGEYGETLRLAFMNRNDHMRASATWDSLPLAHFNPWIKGPELDGDSSGELQLSLAQDKSLEFSLHLTALPALAWNGTSLDFRTCEIDAEWGAQGLNANGRLSLAEHGSLEIEASSPLPGRLSLPDRGDVRLNWRELPLWIFDSFMPEHASLGGLLYGDFAASLQPGARFSLTGTSHTEDARIKLANDSETPSLSLERLEAAIDWNDATLLAQLQLELAGYGSAEAQGRLPLPATLPLVWQKKQPWSGFANLDFPQLQPLGMLSPELFGQTSGSFHAEASLAGTPDAPDYRGAVELRNGFAEIVPANIRLQDVSLQAGLKNDQLQISSLEATSGKGTLRGRGSLDLGITKEQTALDLSLQGEDFRFADLPAISFTISPDLRLHGQPGDLTLEGKLNIPQLLINEPTISTALTPSNDVVLTEELAHEKRVYENLMPGLNIRLTLGDQVFMKVKGLDARLDGDLQLRTGKGNTLAGQGEIRVADGRYAAYGITLPITRGRLLFGGGPIEEPNLDVLAERTIDKVRAGIEVTGTPRKPQIRLTSDPAMADTDILSYIVLGRPLSEDRDQGQSDAMLLAAGALLSRGESAVLREKLSNQLGIDEVSIRNEGGVENTIITVGKYLTPDIYLSYGRGLSNDTGTAQLRYRINEQWQMESEIGNVSGADLYYRIELP